MDWAMLLPPALYFSQHNPSISLPVFGEAISKILTCFLSLMLFMPLLSGCQPVSWDTRGTTLKKNMQGTAHTDTELVSSMMQKITLLEETIEKQAQEIQLKDKRIAELEEKMKTLQKGEDAPGSSTAEELEMRCLQLQTQLWEMERFLNDYGLIWVGERHEQLEDLESLKDEEELPARSIWKPGDAVVAKHQVDFDLILENVKDLNVLAGEGVSQIEYTPGGARLRQPDPLPLTLYQNGIVMFNGPFRPYEDPSTQTFQHSSHHTNRSSPGGISVTMESLRYNHELSLCFSNACRISWTAISLRSCRIATQTASLCRSPTKGTRYFGRETLQGDFLATAKWLAVQNQVTCRKPLRSQVPESPWSSFSTSFPSPQNTEEKRWVSEAQPKQQSRVKTAEEAEASAPDVCTLRVKSESGEQTYIVKMLFTETIGDLRQHLARARWAFLSAQSQGLVSHLC
ncbi:UBX domain-containing protein 11 isoform X3 [Columba livia]|uniref:UBX domain-containing protein 11 isoform X3 n=1 Tax=Columba livia TaxID=8932 RepID=UPI0031BB4FF6